MCVCVCLCVFISSIYSNNNVADWTRQKQKVGRSSTSKTQFTATTSITSSNDEVVSQVPFDLFSSGNIRKRFVLILFFSRRLCKTGKKKRHARLDLCSISAGAGSLSPQNDTLQLHDRYCGCDDDDDESGDGDDGHDNEVLHNIKELRVVQIELCRRQIVQRDVGLWVNHCLHFHLWIKIKLISESWWNNDRF